jgi:DNA primase
MESPVTKTAFLESVVSELALMQNDILRGMLAGQLAEEMHVPEEAVLNLLKKQTRRTRPEYRQEAPKQKAKSAESSLRRPVSGSEKAEFELLRLHLSKDESLLNWLASTIVDEDIHAMHYVEIFQLFRGKLRKELPINHARLLDEIESNELRRFITTLINEAQQDLESISHASQCIKTIKRSRLRREADGLREELRNAEKTGTDIVDLLLKIKQLKGEESNI